MTVSIRVRRLGGALATVLLLAGCAAQTPAPDGAASGAAGGSAGGAGGGATSGSGVQPFELDVDVDTPGMRRVKQRAGMAGCPEGTVARAATEGTPEGGLPSITLPCLGGGPAVDLAGLRGPLVVNLWAQWCGPCREELPHYQRLHEAGAGRVAVLGVDYQDVRPEAALVLAEEAGVTYPSVADPAGEVRAPLRVRGLPGLVLVDTEGRVVHQEFLVIESFHQLADLVQRHLGVRVRDRG